MMRKPLVEQRSSRGTFSRYIVCDARHPPLPPPPPPPSFRVLWASASVHLSVRQINASLARSLVAIDKIALHQRRRRRRRHQISRARATCALLLLLLPPATTTRSDLSLNSELKRTYGRAERRRRRRRRRRRDFIQRNTISTATMGMR